MKILMLHGINHNMFGKRDPVHYGTITLAEIDASLPDLGATLARRNSAITRCWPRWSRDKSAASDWTATCWRCASKT